MTAFNGVILEDTWKGTGIILVYLDGFGFRLHRWNAAQYASIPEQWVLLGPIRSSLTQLSKERDWFTRAAH